MPEGAIRKKRDAGRPRKFAEPSRPITVTLPTRVLRMLQELSPDRARAIARATETAVGAAKEREPMRVEVVEVAPGIGLIIVGPSESLHRIPWLRLAEIAPGRYILTIVPGTAIEIVEVAISDILEDREDMGQSERAMITEILKWIRSLRRAQNITKAELLLVSTRGRRGSRPVDIAGT